MAVAVGQAVTLSGCDDMDDSRIPPYEVSVTFSTIGDWHQWGVHGGGETRDFINYGNVREPANYPFKGLDRTGFGGVMLVCDPNGELCAYDLACPVEVRRDVRVHIDPSAELAGTAVCNECGSTYNIYGYGMPMSGEAREKMGKGDNGYKLRRYRVSVGNQQMPYARISN